MPLFRANSLAFSYIGLAESAKEYRLSGAAAAAVAAIDAAATDADANATAATDATATDADAVANAVAANANAAVYAAAVAAIDAAIDAAVANAATAAAAAATDAAAVANATAATDATADANAALAWDRHQIEAGNTALHLAISPLWPDMDVPAPIADRWKERKGILLSEQADWDIWIDWYEARLKGAPPEPEALAFARVTLPEPMWERGATLVNPAIRELIGLYGKGGAEAVEARMDEFRKAYPEKDREGATRNASGSTDTPSSAFSPSQEQTAKSSENTKNVGNEDRTDHLGAQLGRLIRKKRSAKKLTQKELSLLAFEGVDRSSVISAIETGKVRAPYEATVRALADVLDFSNEDLAPFGAFLNNEETNDDGEAAPRMVETHDTDYVSDRPETDRDLLNRAPLAFTLAHNINKIWSAQTSQADPTPGAVTDGELVAWQRAWSACRRNFGKWNRKVLDCLHFETLNRRTREPDEAAFILHLDAPWGGGKTTFANFVARILNPTGHGYDMDDAERLKGTLLGNLPLKDESYWDPEFLERRWFVVDFNAWQNEHVSPPWWNFYETIRRQCMRALLFERGRFAGPWGWRVLRRAVCWLRFQTTEVIWRVATPEVRNTILLLIFGGLLIYWLVGSEWFSSMTTPPKDGSEATDYSAMLKGLFSLAGIAVTGGAGLALINAFRSGLKTIIDSAGKSANSSSLGDADPIQKFRRHFSWFIGQLDEPVLVIVDDLDRCSPKYVVELVRGLLTIFRSPRVVFVLLGDKDWIETAFAKVHKEMADIHTDGQITFGGRFAEKAIQLSFLLPESDQDAREAYLLSILEGEREEKAPLEMQKTVDALAEVERSARDELSKTDRAEDQQAAAAKTESLIREASAQIPEEDREAFGKAAHRTLNRERMLRTATARSTEKVVRSHGLKPLKDYLPANPRRIKRIVNMVSAYQASAQSAEGVTLGSVEWKQLVIWVVIMSEYPQIWKALVTRPEQADELLNLIEASSPVEEVSLPDLPDDASNEQKVRYSALAEMIAAPGLVPLLRGDPFTGKDQATSPARIGKEAALWLRRLTPID